MVVVAQAVGVAQVVVVAQAVGGGCVGDDPVHL